MANAAAVCTLRHGWHQAVLAGDGKSDKGVRGILDRIAASGTALRDRILLDAATHDLEENAVAKADWILASIKPSSTEETARALIKSWTATDPLAASLWLDTVPVTSAWRSSAILEFAKTIEPHDPEAAREWRLAAGTP